MLIGAECLYLSLNLISNILDYIKVTIACLYMNNKISFRLWRGNCRGGRSGGDTGGVWNTAAWVYTGCECSKEEAPSMARLHDEVSYFT